MKGQIIKSTGLWYLVRSETNEVLKARLRGKFKHQGLKLTNPIAVGDIVNYEIEDTQSQNYIITKIEPRQNLFVRKSSRKKAFDHIIASNIDQAVLFATLRFPKTSLGFIDRFLVCAESYRIPAYVIFNKSDVYKEKDFERYEMLKKYYDSIGYTTMLCSVEKEEGLEPIEKLLKNKTTLIAGPSGVGKSSVVNYFNSELELNTGEVSTYNNKGTHVTTHAEMHTIFENSFIIDSPGIKEIGITGITKYELKDQFPEMRAYINKCKYNDCLHLEEPQCRVTEAVGNESIADWRYISYLSILDEL